jgi:hypothetical protein
MQKYAEYAKQYAKYVIFGDCQCFSANMQNMQNNMQTMQNL